MTATTLRPTRRGGAIRDALLLAWRNFKHHARVPSLVVFPLMTPIIFLLLFRYVLGGSIVIPGVSYVDFLVPGIVVQSITFGATQTGVGLAADVNQGITDRFRALPISRSAVVAGRTLIDAGRNALLVMVVLTVGLVIGFRPDTNPVRIITAISIALAFAYAFSWVAALIGVSIRHAEAVHDAGFVWVIPLTFASSALVAVDSMPTGVRWLANINPVTNVADAVRALLLGDPAGDALARSVIWIAGLLVVFVPLAVRAYQQR
jgi:ABC-2 type transport system permease protein/oleandomycin transport system permease protein